MRQIMGAIAEYDRVMLVAKLRGARNRVKARDGRCEGRKPFGFYPEEKDILARMIKLRKAGLSVQAIVTMFNQDGIKPRIGAKWHLTSAMRVLRREAPINKMKAKTGAKE
jgi:hypothetical protein